MAWCVDSYQDTRQVKDLNSSVCGVVVVSLDRWIGDLSGPGPLEFAVVFADLDSWRDLHSLW